MIRDVKKNNKGITFIALIVTIVVLIIILSISVAILTNDSGIIKKTDEASESKNKSEEKEAVEWAAAQTVGDSDIGKVEQNKFKGFLDEYIGDGKDNGFDYVIDGNYTGIFVVEFTTSGNKYTVDDNGNVFDGEQVKRDGITVDPSNITINVGETKQLSYLTGSDADKVVWSTENDGIAKVDNNGLVTGVANGTVTITATTEKGKTSECYVTVQTEPTGLKVEPTEALIDLSATSRLVQITPTIIPSTANVQTKITYSTSDANVAEVNESGIVTGKSNGNAIITARTENGIEATCNITVQTSPSGLNLNVTNATLDITDDPSLDLTAKIVPETSSINTGITWSSSNPAIAEVVGKEGNATVTAKSNGEVEITATTSNGQSITCKITVHTSPSRITVSEQNILLDLSDPTVAPSSKNLIVTIYPDTADVNRDITWTSSKTDVAVVSRSGKDNATGTVTGKSNGTTVITAQTPNGRSITTNVTVQTTPLSISLNHTSATLDTTVTNTVQLSVSYNPVTSNVKRGITWTSSNTGIATVNSSGLVTGVANGTAVITATTENGKKDTCNITVQTSPTGITINNTGVMLDINGTKSEQLTTTISPSTANVNTGLTWSSDATNIATVNGSGVVTGVANGTANITVRTTNGKTATCSVTVQTSPTSITLNKSSATLNLTGPKTTQLSVTYNPSSANIKKGITWTSSNTGIATVNSSGLVTGVAVGSATITATTENGKTASCNITVKRVPTISDTNKTYYLRSYTETFNEGEGHYEETCWMENNCENVWEEIIDAAVGTVTGGHYVIYCDWERVCDPPHWVSDEYDEDYTDSKTIYFTLSQDLPVSNLAVEKTSGLTNVNVGNIVRRSSGKYYINISEKNTYVRCDGEIILKYVDGDYTEQIYRWTIDDN